MQITFKPASPEEMARRVPAKAPEPIKPRAPSRRAPKE
jgi:hypothetical protein